MQGVSIGLGLEKFQQRAMPLINKSLLALLTFELVFQYFSFITFKPAGLTARVSYAREVAGYLLNSSSYITFGLKVTLFVLEAYRHQFVVYLQTLETSETIKGLIKRSISQSSSTLDSFIVPISHFAFCILAIMFALLHPSVLYAPFLPLFMVAFFIQPQPTRNYFSIVATVLIVVSTLYILSLYAF